mgnify:CR=1 FL=1
MKKAYIVYLDDGQNVFKVHIPAENEKEARDFVRGNGEIIACKPSLDRNEENPISMDLIMQALQNASFGQMEIDLITRALDDCSFIQ